MNNIKELKGKKLAMSWLIVVACMLLQAIPFGIASNIHPQFLWYIREAEGFGLGEISLMFTVGTIISAIFSPMIGKLFTKFSAKIIFTVGAAVSAGGIFVLGIAGNKLPLFYIGYGIAQVGIAAISSIGIPVLMMSWFDDSLRGRALGLSFAGGSIGNIFLQQISVNWIVKYGYAAAYRKFALLSLVVGVGISLLLIKTRKNKGEVVAKKETEKEKSNKKEENIESSEGFSLAEVKKMKSFWMLAVAFAFVGMYVSPLATQYSAYLRYENFDPSMLGVVGSVFAIFSLFGNLTGGTLYDKFGTAKTTVIGFILALVSCISLIFAPKMPFLAYIYAITKGLSVFAYVLAPAMVVGALYGNKEFGAILGIVQVFFAFGFAFGSAIFGWIFDIAGYPVAWSFILFIVVAAYSMLLISIKAVNKIGRPEIKSEEVA